MLIIRVFNRILNGFDRDTRDDLICRPLSIIIADRTSTNYANRTQEHTAAQYLARSINIYDPSNFDIDENLAETWKISAIKLEQR